MSKRDQALQIKQDLARIYKSRCAICQTKKASSGFTFHHLWYEDDEKTYKDFDNVLDYYNYLAPLIRQNPKRFLYLCSNHHQALERTIRYGEKLWRNLNKYRRLTLRSRQAR